MTIDAHMRMLAEIGDPRARLMLGRGRTWRVDLDEPPRPKGLRRGRAKQCYFNAGRWALDYPEWQYVEGYVALGSPVIEHAWLTADADRVIEPTLSGYGTEYFGIIVTLDALRQHLTDRRCWCVFCHEALARRGISKAPRRVFGENTPGAVTQGPRPL